MSYGDPSVAIFGAKRRCERVSALIEVLDPGEGRKGGMTYPVVLMRRRDPQGVRDDQEYEDEDRHPDMNPYLPQEARQHQIQRPQHKQREAPQHCMR